MHRLDLNSVINVTDVPCVVLTDTPDQEEILRILKSDGVKGCVRYVCQQPEHGF